MRRFDAFSDHDFELFVADLFGAEFGRRYEVFTRGADGGIDLRFSPSDGGPSEVVQCKHYAASSFSKLEAAAKAEGRAIAKMVPKPSAYRFATSQTLTPANKSKLVAALGSSLTSTADIFGLHDIEVLLNAHESVERRHPKLWLTGSAQLERVIHAGTYERSLQLLEDTQRSLSTYVETKAFFEARDRLGDERVIVIAGPPGIGKTTLARLLLADAALDGYEAIDVTRDIDEANAVFRADQRQIFYYDDFLGTTFLDDRLAKNEDQRLANFVRKVAASTTSRFVLTTREYILRQAVLVYESFARESLTDRRYLLRLDEYTPSDKTRILYNHAWHSTVIGSAERRSLAEDAGYRRIVQHPNYNPRLIESLTGTASRPVLDEGPAEFVERVVGVLNRPHVIWDHAFRQLADQDRLLVLCVASMPGPADLEDLALAFRSHTRAARVATVGPAFRDALKVAEDSFIRTSADRGHVLASPLNPAVVDFAAQWLQDSPNDADAMVEGAYFFEQLEWLFRTLGPSAALGDAVRRTWASADPQWVHTTWSGPDDVRLTRAWIAPATRLQFVLRTMDQDPNDRMGVRAWFDETLEQLAASWGVDHVVHVDSPLSLIEALKRSGMLTSRLVEHARAYVVKDLDDASDWRQVSRLRAVDGEAFPDSEWSDLQERFRTFADDAMSGGFAEVQSTDDLSEIEDLADDLGVGLDEILLEEASEELSRRIAEREAEADGRADEARLEDHRYVTRDEDHFDALFSRMAEE